MTRLFLPASFKIEPKFQSGLLLYIAGFCRPNCTVGLPRRREAEMLGRPIVLPLIVAVIA